MKLIKLHTVFLLVGPSNCGKSYFAQQRLIPKLRQSTWENINIQYLSTDAIRRQLIGQETCGKYRHIMTEASGPTFDLLYFTLKKVVEFPIKAEFVIVDSTGLSKDFRQNISKICHENQYNLDLVLFQYREKSYFQLPGGNSEVIRKHVQKMKGLQKDLKDLQVNNRHYIKSPEEVIGDLEIIDQQLYLDSRLDPEYEYFVIGDVHGCYDELIKLITQNGFVIEDDIVKTRKEKAKQKIIFIGDLIDKGPKVPEVIRFVYKNFKHPEGILMSIKGNHENTVYKLLNGLSKESQYDKELLENYFSTYYLLKEESNKELAEEFNFIHDKMPPFLYYQSGDNLSQSFYLSHSPCSLKYLGKTDSRSLKAQLYCRIDRERDLQEQFRAIIGYKEGQDQYNFPSHIFGHIAFDEPYVGVKEGNNRIGIDTGCVEGRQLTGVWVGRNISRPKFNCIGQPPVDKKVVKREVDTDKVKSRWELLKPFDQKRIGQLIKNKVNFISGTISPADKEQKTGVLESLGQALNYFEKRGVHRLVVQHKYMGSRCNVYLDCQQRDKSFSISRNGYCIKGIAAEEMLSKVYQPLYDHLEPFIKEHNIKRLVVDGELMPWNAMGEQLIESQFRVIDRCLEQEIEVLRHSSFAEQLEEVYQKVADTGFSQLVDTTSKQRLKKQFGDTDYTTMDSLRSHQRIDLDEEQRFHARYHQQLENFGQDGKLELRPFNLLKIVFDNDEETIPFIPNEKLYLNQAEIFELLNGKKTDYCLVDLEKEGSREEAERFYQDIVQREMEGVVVKPVDYTVGWSIAPYLKVRNEDYLSIIYGYNYQKSCYYQRLIGQKNIAPKIKASIRDFTLGLELLSIKTVDLQHENWQLRDILMNLVAEELPMEIDPRL